MKRLKDIFVGLLVALVLCVPAVADNGCENDDNDAIVAELALCSTHAYNIGKTENPTGADKELMRDVIAMKTTLITQQMYRQYEQMDSMLRRLKTQLEKAVLTTGLEAKGASSSSSSSSGGSSFKSDDRNIHMAGVKNCLNYYQDSEILKCYEDNLNMIVNMSGNGDSVSSELKKQLVQDFCKLSSQRINSSYNCTDDKKNFEEYCSGSDAKKPQTLDKRNFQAMIDAMRSCLQNQYRAYNNSQKQMKKE
jgi:hypothetical protein